MKRESCIYHFTRAIDHFNIKLFMELFVFQILSQILIIQFLIFPSWNEPVQVGTISNVIMSSSNVTIVSMNESCIQCICLMLLETNVLGVSCSQNQTCLLFHNYSLPYSLNDSPNSSFHFLILPPEQGDSIYGSTQRSQLSELQ
jgi:hypothetical protein